MDDRALNPFELYFAQAAEDPSKLNEFYAWCAKTEFLVPAQELRPALTSRGREIIPGSLTRIQLKAFNTEQGLCIPIFSEQKRFEKWSEAEPAGRFFRASGRALVSLLPVGAAVLLNPGSERFSKWFTADEIRLLIK